MVAGDFNGHVGAAADDFEGVHGGFGIGARNSGGRRLLELCVEANLVPTNTWFKKERKATVRSGGCETEIDFILVQQAHRRRVRNIKVIPGELQHSLVVAVVDKLDAGRKDKKRPQVKWTKVWRLKDEAVRMKFEARMNTLYEQHEEPDNWDRYRTCVKQTAEEVCGISKGKPPHGETWWWKPELQDVIRRKRVA